MRQDCIEFLQSRFFIIIIFVINIIINFVLESLFYTVCCWGREQKPDKYG